MRPARNHNAFVFLTTLSVCLGLMLVGSTTGVSAQNVSPAGDSSKTNSKKSSEVPVAASPDEIVVNIRPLKDFASAVKAKVDEQKLDLSKSFSLKAVAVLKMDGTLDVAIDKKTRLPNSRIISSDGDNPMQEIAKQAIEAVGNSGFFLYLTTLGVDKIELMLGQDEERARIIITSDMPTPEKASAIAKGLELIIGVALAGGQSGKMLGPDETVLLQGAKSESSGKQFILNFTIPKPVAQEMITRRLREVTPAPTPSSTVEAKDGKSNGE